VFERERQADRSMLEASERGLLRTAWLDKEHKIKEETKTLGKNKIFLMLIR
jgi:hypothetical protein